MKSQFRHSAPTQQFDTGDGSSQGGNSGRSRMQSASLPDRSGVGLLRRSRPRPPKLYRIGEVVEYSGMSRQTIHNYTTMGLLPEKSWTQGGHRLYDESAFERLDLIAEFKSRNKSLHDIREYFTRHYPG